MVLKHFQHFFAKIIVGLLLVQQVNSFLQKVRDLVKSTFDENRFIKFIYFINKNL